MKKIDFLFLGVSLIISNINIAQNPFASIGKKSKPMLSLSDGKYVEHFENDSVRQIGSAIVNVYTEQIVAFVDRKAQSKKLHSQTSSRFLSVDPLARQFPFYTPYQYAANTPISAIDMDGMESFVATKDFSANVIKLTLLNAEDALSVTWAETDKETKTDPLMISEVSKFVYNVKVDKNTGKVTYPESGITKAYSFTYQKFEKNTDGSFKTDVDGNQIPRTDQGIGVKNPSAYTKKISGISVGGGNTLSGRNNDDELINDVGFGTGPSQEYNRVDIFVDPKLRGAVTDKLKSLDKDFDTSKINWLDKPNTGDSSTQYDIDFVKEVKGVSEIE